MKRSTRIALTGAALAAASLVAYAVPGPSRPGESYYYRDDSGQVVGRIWIDCDGDRHEEGTPTANFSVFSYSCPPPTW